MTAQDLAQAVYRHDEAYASTDAFLEAYERGDAAACAAFYTKDATVLPGDRPVAIGRAEIEALFAGIFEHGAKKLSLIPGEVSCDGDLAYEIGTAILEIPQSDGSLLFDERRYLTVLKRQSDGSWRMQASAWRGARGD
jgi:uncharacterized protein (TIGR02246 family)